MEKIVAVATAVRNDEYIPVSEVLSSLKEAAMMRREQNLFERVFGDTFVVGPIRGHGSDFAHYLLSVILPNDSVENIVFLGNYIDGAHQALSVLYLVALLILHSNKRVIPLIGKHEHFYPMRCENFGSLQKELELRARSDGVEVEEYESIVKKFFSSLAVGCVVDNTYFCVAGGPASGFPLLSKLNEASSHDELQEFFLNSPMDEDEENMAVGYAFFHSPDELGFHFTFNAACNFLTRNKLAALIVGTDYYTDRPEYDSFAKPNHYKLSVYFPGYTLGRIHPLTKLPAVTSVFSAPQFCGVNWNNACILQISDKRIIIRELTAFSGRKLILPGPQDHCFSWAQPLLEKAVVSLARLFLFHQEPGDVPPPDDENVAEKEEEHIAVGKMRRMCELLEDNRLPFPVIPKFSKSD